MLKTIVCDDEEPALDLISAMLAETGKIELVSACRSVRQALDLVDQGGIDLLVLDIEMPELTGVEAVRQIRAEPKPLLIFATAHPEYAADAFGIDAIDYLLKPIEPARVRHAVEKACRLHRLIQSTAGPDYDPPLIGNRQTANSDGLRLQDGNRFYVIPHDSILWIEAAGDYSLIHSAGSEIAVRHTISSIESALPAARFCRVHRSAIVAIEQIREVRKLIKGEAEILLSDGSSVKSSRSYKDAVARLVKS